MNRYDSSARSCALSVLEGFASQRLLNKAASCEVARTHVWTWDPYVPDVVGLVRTNNTNHADIIVYLRDDDFEVDGDFEPRGTM